MVSIEILITSSCMQTARVPDTQKKREEEEKKNALQQN
jgi:hypothetical protein